ncbi:hypothetical protein TNCV_2257111 [Trichonephila clavipes]|nr:hypothetical protein TNCV_2257111 [Trichonephila clavipes]
MLRLNHPLEKVASMDAWQSREANLFQHTDGVNGEYGMVGSTLIMTSIQTSRLNRSFRLRAKVSKTLSGSSRESFNTFGEDASFYGVQLNDIQ